ncbi:hypothetical protein IIE_05270 [Bacillus cereus VD045]|nr:hypothetical protein IIE_05270 [Bacillus cereus VD045]
MENPFRYLQYKEYSITNVVKETILTKNQVGYLIKYKHIESINLDTWRAGGGYCFEKEDVKRLEELYKDCLTLKEAAEFLNKSKTYVHNAAKDGILPFKEIAKGKSTERLYLKSDL